MKRKIENILCRKIFQLDTKYLQFNAWYLLCLVLTPFTLFSACPEFLIFIFFKDLLPNSQKKIPSFFKFTEIFFILFQIHNVWHLFQASMKRKLENIFCRKIFGRNLLLVETCMAVVVVVVVIVFKFGSTDLRVRNLRKFWDTFRLTVTLNPIRVSIVGTWFWQLLVKTFPSSNF